LGGGACNPGSVPDRSNGTTAVSCATSPLTGNVIRYAYDADGNVLTKTDGRNIQISYGYDALNRLITASYNDSTPAALRCYDADVPNATNTAEAKRSQGALSGENRIEWDYSPTLRRIIR
jgi:YD repeat-containing protein